MSSSSSSSPPPSSTSLLLPTTISILLLLLLPTSHPLPFSATKPPPSTTTTNPPPPRLFKKIFAFGDSFTDTGNTRSKTGPSGFAHVSNPPYGVTYFHHSTNRYSDGRLVIDFVTEYLSLPFLPPYLSVINRKSKNDTQLSSAASNGVNFAVAGSTAINYEFFARNNLSLDISPHSILSQLVWFNKYLESQGCGKGGCKEVFEESLFWIGEIGVNDYAYTIGSTIDGDVIQKLALNSVTAFLESLLKRGAKYMVVQGLPASGCLPLAMYLSPENDRDDIGCVKSANNQTYSHNAILQDRICKLRKQYPDSVIVYADYWNAYHTVMKNAAKYGFKNKFDACCGSGESYNFNPLATCGTTSATLCSKPSEYINWDGVHLTEAMYKVVSNMFLKGRFSHPPFSYLMSKKQRRRG